MYLNSVKQISGADCRLLTAICLLPEAANGALDIARSSVARSNVTEPRGKSSPGEATAPPNPPNARGTPPCRAKNATGLLVTSETDRNAWQSACRNTPFVIRSSVQIDARGTVQTASVLAASGSVRGSPALPDLPNSLLKKWRVQSTSVLATARCCLHLVPAIVMHTSTCTLTRTHALPTALIPIVDGSVSPKSLSACRSDLPWAKVHAAPFVQAPCAWSTECRCQWPWQLTAQRDKWRKSANPPTMVEHVGGIVPGLLVSHLKLQAGAGKLSSS